MAANRIDLMDIRQLIRLKIKGKSNRKIALLLHISRNTVNQYVSLLSATEHAWPALLEMDDARLLELLPKPAVVDGQLYEQLLNYFPTYLKELSKPGCTLLNLWQEYIAKHTEGYKYWTQCRAIVRSISLFTTSANGKIANKSVANLSIKPQRKST